MNNNKILLIFIIIFGLTITACSNNVNSEELIFPISDDPDKVTIYFFWGDGCPHCESQKPFLESLEQKHDVEVKSFETWKNRDNAKLFGEVAKAYGFTAQGVPTTFIGDEYWVGYSSNLATEMEIEVVNCIENGCINPGNRLNQ